MSYTRHFREQISGSVQVSVNYPASERGGTTYATGHWSENIDIAIEVDTNPFDHSVNGVKRDVDLLTGAVVATGTAHALAKRKAGGRISETIINGFFGNIRAEIKQQMIEVQALLTPKLLELKAQAQRCKAIEEQMEGDYRRITERYARLFTDLDQELERRIGSLDKPSFLLMDQGTRAADQTRNLRQSSVPTMTAKEKEEIGSVLLLGAVKHHALEMIDEGQDFIVHDDELSRSLEAMLLKGQVDGRTTVTIPVVAMVCDGLDSDDPLRAVYRPGEGELKASGKWAAIGDSADGWRSLLDGKEGLVGDYLDCRLKASMADTAPDPAEARVAVEMRRLWSQWRDK